MTSETSAHEVRKQNPYTDTAHEVRKQNLYTDTAHEVRKQDTYSDTPHRVRSEGTSAHAPIPPGVFQALIPEIRKALDLMGYTKPTPVQEKSIPHVLLGRDLVGTAQTGTGKTAAYVLPMIQRLAADRHRPVPGTPRALILAPTRELAAQIDQSVSDYGRFLQLKHAVIFGGVSQHGQEKALGLGVDFLTATPGRLLDLAGQGIVKLVRVQILVLDEVDRMLDMGFIPDVRRILALVQARRQTLFFSATLPREIEDLAGSMVRNPVRVSIDPDVPAVEKIRQKVVFVEKGEKDTLLISLLNDPEVSKALVFTRMKHTANKVVRKLAAGGIAGVAIHGNKSQSARTSALAGFREDRVRVLVATDVASRGIDVEHISHVINYDLPVEAETYVHRIGRTARAGAGGNAISFCCPEERECLDQIERLLGRPVSAGADRPQRADLTETPGTSRTSSGGRRRRRRVNNPGRAASTLTRP